MKKLLPLLGLAAAAYFLFLKKPKFYKVLEVDGPNTYVILKQGDSYWQFDVPTAMIGKALSIAANASIASKRDYDAIRTTEYPS